MADQTPTRPPWWEDYGPPIEVTFPAANTRRDVAHRLQAVPDAYAIIRADGPVHQEPGVWAFREIAYLRSTAAGTKATVIFYTLRETRLAP